MYGNWGHNGDHKSQGPITFLVSFKDCRKSCGSTCECRFTDLRCVVKYSEFWVTEMIDGHGRFVIIWKVIKGEEN